MLFACGGDKRSDSTPSMTLLTSSQRTATRFVALPLPPREATLRRLSAFSGACAQQRPCCPACGSVQGCPSALVALHTAFNCLTSFRDFQEFRTASASLRTVWTNSSGRPTEEEIADGERPASESSTILLTSAWASRRRRRFPKDRRSALLKTPGARPGAEREQVRRKPRTSSRWRLPSPRLPGAHPPG